MPSHSLDRLRSIANNTILDDGIRRTAMDAIAEIMKCREALYRVAPSYQGGHSIDGGAIADALGCTFPLRVPELEAMAKDEKMDTTVLWPWLYEMRRREAKR